MPKDFVSLADWPADELWGLLDRARELKELDRGGQRPQTLQGRVLALFFEKPSLRTHVTFEAGMTQLGGHAILLRPEQVGIGTRESPGDVARNLSRWLDGLVARTFSHNLVEEFAAAATIPTMLTSLPTVTAVFSISPTAPPIVLTPHPMRPTSPSRVPASTTSLVRSRVIWGGLFSTAAAQSAMGLL